MSCAAFSRCHSLCHVTSSHQLTLFSFQPSSPIISLLLRSLGAPCSSSGSKPAFSTKTGRRYCCLEWLVLDSQHKKNDQGEGTGTASPPFVHIPCFPALFCFQCSHVNRHSNTMLFLISLFSKTVLFFIPIVVLPIALAIGLLLTNGLIAHAFLLLQTTM